MTAGIEARLPPLVRGYAQRVLANQPQAPRTVRVAQLGEMVLKPRTAPRRFSAIEEFAVDRVAFAWKARFPIAGPLGQRVTDSYNSRDGLLEVRLLGLPIRRKHDAELARGEAFRYLAEIPRMPQAIIANPELQWQQIDSRTVELATETGGARIALRLVFNDHGEVEQTVADRPRLEAGGEATPWTGVFSDYRELGDTVVPTRGEVRWELPDGPFTYWRATVTSLEPLS